MLAFSKKDPVIQRTLLNYRVKEVTQLFKKINEYSNEKIATLIGYPNISEFDSSLENNPKIKKDYLFCLENIQEELTKVGKFYLENLEFYNDYKHGFRIFPSTSSPPDSKTWGATVRIVRGKSLNKATFYTNEILDKKVEEAKEISSKIAQILDVLIPIFQERFIRDKKEFSLKFFGIPEAESDTPKKVE